MSDTPIMLQTQTNQRRATDPAASAWVSANAGTGKTYVLVRRVLRLLLAGAAPDRILCLTFTKAAAAEMANRLFGQLAAWATSADLALADDLANLIGRPATAQQRAIARTLFAASLEAPGGLKVQTIHAFCERVLQRFPLEAGLTPSFSVLDSEQQGALVRTSIDRVLSAANDGDGPLREALQTVVAIASDTRFDTLLTDAIKKREEISDLIAKASTTDDPFGEIEARLKHHFGVPAGATDASLRDDMLALLPSGQAERIHEVLATGKKSDVDAADRLSEVMLAPTPGAKQDALAVFLLTQKDEPRARQMTKDLAAAHPDFNEQLHLAAADAALLLGKRLGVRLATASAALLRLADAVLGHYAQAKARAAALDYDDLIARAAGLLSSANDTRWVLFKLDGGLDHILVDEAQDTNPLQWRIVTALAEEFFADAGAGARLRTVFAVGDEKQSIYGFQGARPEEFDRIGRDFERKAREAAVAFARVPLTLSFRSVAPVLAAVDAVFAPPEAAAGLNASGEAIRHQAHRIGQAGLVEIWPTETTDEVEAGEPWSPLQSMETKGAAERLAARIAGTIAGWIARGERLASQDRPITTGDVLILLRKRQPFAPVMIRALKTRGLAVAGADRIKVTEQIAVEDLVSLGSFLLLPEDDLALAEVLLSPLIGLTDEDLFTIGHRRKGSLWGALIGQAGSDPRYAEGVEALKRWRSEADFLPPFEFYKRLLDKDGRRARLLARLGPEAGDAIDEFLNLAIRFDADEPPTLQGFLHWIGRAAPEIKRDMDQGRNEVRVMTIHGAKGLEAPIVFLPDTCSSRGAGAPTLLPLREGEPLVWMIKGASKLDAVDAAKAAHDDRERRERNRLLYVAITRARDRLYVTGFEGSRGRDEGCWYDLVAGALSPGCASVREADGRIVLRMDAAQTAEPEIARAAGEGGGAAVPYPDWAMRNAPRAEARSVPLAPSRLAPLETEEGSGVAAPIEVAPSPRLLGAGNRFLRGSLTHALLQHLPEIAPARRKATATKYLAARAAEFPARARASIVAEVMAILEHPQFSIAFGPGSAAEVPIAAEVLLPSGPPLRIAGQIDRLFASSGRVTIIDYKTNRPPPAELAGVPDSYLLQLAAYRLAVKRIYASQTVEAALLWTDGARLMAVPAALLDDHEKAILSGRPWA